MNGIDPVKKLISITSSLQGLVECPICLEPAKIPIKQCATGHIVCGKCTDKLKGCPTCREPFTLENPIGYKKLLEALPRFCRNVGCPEVLGSDDHEHETYCGYRTIGCAHGDCLEGLKVNQLLNHFEDEHFGAPYQSGENMVTKDAVEYYSAQQFCKLPIAAFGSIFWLEEIYDAENKKLELVFKFAPVEKPTEDYFITIEFLNGNDFKCTNTLKAVADCDENPHEEPSVEKGTCLIVPHSLMMMFVGENGNLDWKISCFNRKLR